MSHQLRRMRSDQANSSTTHSRETKMKKILFGAVAALVLSPAAVLAADMPLKAPVPIAIYNWTGFYIGGEGGGSLGTSNQRSPTGDVYTLGYDVRGGLAGGTFGYNWQFSSFVFGLEGDASWVGENGSHPDDGPVVGNPAFVSFTKETWLATVRARFGYAVNNLLFYGTGGYAGAGVTAGVKDGGANSLIVSSSSTRNGWTAGGGLEWGFAPSWSAKFEWLYMKFDSGSGFNTLNLGPGIRGSVPLDDNVVRAGINYRFGGPVVAKY
jgi:outer membrane immunogenic protein